MLFQIFFVPLQLKRLLHTAMKKFELFFLSMAALLLTSCAPKVVTDMYTSEFDALSPDSVRVFLMNEKVPEQTLAIGTVKVVDGGLAAKGSFEQVLDLAVKATAKNGGNGLVITEHRMPDTRSTIHRIWGTMLRMPETESDTSVVKGSLDRALAQPADNQYMQTFQSPYEEIKKRNENAPRNILRFSVGPSWMTSNFQVGNKIYESKCGVDVEVDYDHVWVSGFGIGVNYLHNYTSFEEGFAQRLNYIGPSLVLALPSDKWRWDMAMGFGYCSYSESVGKVSVSESHIAPLMRIGLEYKVSKQIALGAQMNMITVKLDKPDDVVLKENEFYGIRRIGLQVGMRYYF